MNTYLIHDPFKNGQPDYIDKAEFERCLDEIRNEIDNLEYNIEQAIEEQNDAQLVLDDPDSWDEGERLFAQDSIRENGIHIDRLEEQINELKQHDVWEMQDVLNYRGDLLIHRSEFYNHIRSTVDEDGIPSDVLPYIDWDQYVEDQKSAFAEIGDYYVEA